MRRTLITLMSIFALCGCGHSVSTEQTPANDPTTCITEEERAAATENMVEEIADVLISIVNVMEIFSFDKNEINRQINKKQDRLRKRMGLEDNAND